MSTTASKSPVTPENLESFLLEVADSVSTTLDLDSLLRRIAEQVRRVIDYEIFAILLVIDRTQELRIRFAIGHPQELIDSTRIRIGEGVTGLAAQRREAILVTDVAGHPNYIEGVSGVRSELAVPLVTKNKVIGVIDVEAPQPGFFTEEHKRLLTLVASRIAVAVENARLYSRIRAQNKSLKLLNDISREVTSILDLDKLFKTIGDKVNSLIPYQMFSVLLLDTTGTKLVHRFSLRFNENIHLKHDIPLGKGLVGYAASHKEPVLVADVSRDERYINLNPETRSELCVPLIHKDNVIGVLDIEHTQVGYFTESHLRTMTTLAAQVAISIENARLYEKVARHEQQMERDLALARELQFRIMPPCCPMLRNAEVFARFSPAHFIGGDLYDFVPYGRGGRQCCRLGIAIGDVSGKGAPAAIYAALVSGFLRSHAASQPSPSEMMVKINRSLNERPVEAQYISMIYALWDDEQKQLRIANSGLPRPIYCHNGNVERVETAGLPMGLFENAEYDEVTYNTHEGDLFVFFSDGIIDAADNQGRMFGRSRLEDVVAKNCDQTAEVLVNAIFHAVSQHAAAADPFDDQTVVAMKIRRSAKKR